MNDSMGNTAKDGRRVVITASLSVLLLGATIAFVLLMVLSATIREWVWARHQNVLSWYVRPILVLPICFFAWRRSLIGVFASILCLFTSMAWFGVPGSVDPRVASFLQAEITWLTSDWTLPKVLLTLTVPAFFVLLAASVWRRSLPMALLVMAAAAIGKSVWSVLSSEGGVAVLKPALAGLVVCGVAVFLLMRKRGRAADKPGQVAAPKGPAGP